MPDAGPRDADRLWLLVRLGSFYVAAFAVLGIWMQFFPVWLHDARGCSPADVTEVLSGQIFARTIAGPLWARHVDRCGRPRAVLIALAIASALAFAAFHFAHGKLALACCAVAFGLCYPPMHPILDALALRTCAPAGVSFGRVRLWGSLSFLVTILVVGLSLSGRADDPAGRRDGAWWVFASLLTLLLVTAAAGWQLPDARTEPSRQAPLRELLGSRWFLLFLAGAGLIQGSHAAYYNLSTLHWRDHGIDAAWASALWAEGILAEVVLFAVVRGSLARWRPTTWLLLGAAGAGVRWCIVAGTTSLPVLVATNWLHAVSFGCTFLGSLQFIQQRVAPDRQATAQGLLGAAASGVGMALASLLAGRLHERSPAAAFLTMAALAAVGAAAVWRLRQRPRRALDPSPPEQ